MPNLVGIFRHPHYTGDVQYGADKISENGIQQAQNFAQALSKLIVGEYNNPSIIILHSPAPRAEQMTNIVSETLMKNFTVNVQVERDLDDYRQGNEERWLRLANNIKKLQHDIVLCISHANVVNGSIASNINGGWGGGQSKYFNHSSPVPYAEGVIIRGGRIIDWPGINAETI